MEQDNLNSQEPIMSSTQPQVNNMQFQQPMMPMNVAPETTKNRSAYVAALLHIVFGLFGFGYYYRGMDDKAKECWIMFIVGTVLTPLFGIGTIILAVAEIINLVDAIKLFNGKITVDNYGRKLYQEF